jgi:hypothetical protein
MRHAHPVEHNAAINVERIRPQWSEEELSMVVEKEVEIRMANPQVRFINEEVLRGLDGKRTLESIRCLRKQDRYKERLAKKLAEHNLSQNTDKRRSPEEDSELREDMLSEIRAYLRALTEKPPLEKFRERWLDSIVGKALKGRDIEADLTEYLTTVVHKDKALRQQEVDEECLEGNESDSSVVNAQPAEVMGEVEGVPIPATPQPRRPMTRAQTRQAQVRNPEVLRAGVEGQVVSPPSIPRDSVAFRARRKALSRAEGISLLKSLPPTSPPVVETVKTKAKPRAPKTPKGVSKSKARVLLYRRTQSMYKSDRSRVANLILDGKDIDGKSVYLPGIAKSWADSFREVPEMIDTSGMKHRDPYDITVWHPIKFDELDEAVRLLKKKSAAGPDEVSVALLKSFPRRVLLKLVNLFLLVGRLPRCLKTSRTVLIPKKKEVAEPSDFRPISISPVIVRLFHKVLAKRITLAADLDVRQRGFLPVDGCAENIMILESAIHETKNLKRSAYIVTLDIKNAFGSVSHEAILKALECSGAPGLLVDYVRDLYENFKTEVKYGREAIKTPINRGVLQGDPMSPILFNLVIDQILRALPESVGINLSAEVRANAMGFADDMVLMAATEVGIRALTQCIDQVSPRFGLHFHPGKCTYLALVWAGKVKKVKVVTDLKLEIGGGRMRSTDVHEAWRYLGAFFGPWGIQKANVSLESLLDRLRKAKLKPQQKLYVLRVHLLPRLIHCLVMAPVRVTLLDKLDRMVRGALTGKQGILHLPQSVPSSYFYAPVKMGGLGLTEFRTSIPALIFRRFERMSISDSPLVRAASMNVANCNRVRLATKFLKLNEDGTRVLGRFGVRRYHADRLHKSWDGMKLKEAERVPQVHSWVSDGSNMMTGQVFCEALNIRINSLPTLARYYRGQNKRKTCRAGCHEVESLHHVLQVCPRTHDIRCTRHNKVAKKLSSFLRQKGHVVHEEPLINTKEGLRKPDIISIRDEVATVIDVQIGGDKDLNRAHYKKVQFYSQSPEVTARARSLGGVEAKYSACIISPQGLFSRKSARDLLDLGLTTGMLRTLVVVAIEQSTYIWHVFNRSTKSTWKRRQK